MRFLWAAILSASSLIAGQPAKPAVTAVMYLVNRKDAIADFRAHAARTSIVAPQTFTMDAQGFILGEVPPEVLRAAADHHVAVMPLVVNKGFNQPLMHTVLDTPASRARAIRYLLYYALRDGYLGFQFDYENIHYTYRDKFTVFFKEAARAFHRHHLQLSAAIVGRYNDSRNSNSPGGWDNWSGVYDYAELGRYADFLSVMAYAEHGATADPGPVAGLPWVKSIAVYSGSRIPPSRISLGVPFYAMRWEMQDTKKWRGRSARYSDAATAIVTTQPIWDGPRASPHLSFLTAGHQTELWYEDAHSLQAKMQLARSMHFAGISAWALGQEDPAFWTSLDAWKIRHPRPLSSPALSTIAPAAPPTCLYVRW